MIALIQQALMMGYTASQVLKYVSSKFKKASTSIQNAQQMGYADEDILKYLGGKIKPKNTKGVEQQLSSQERYMKSIGLKTKEEKEQTKNKYIGSAVNAAGVALGAYGIYKGFQGLQGLNQGVGIPKLGYQQPRQPLGPGPNSPGVQVLNPTPRTPNKPSGAPQTPQPGPNIGAQIQGQAQAPIANAMQPTQPKQAAKAAQAPTIQPKSAQELLIKNSLIDQVNNFSKTVKDPRAIAGILFNKFPREMRQLQTDAGKNMEDVIGEYLQSNSATMQQPKQEITSIPGQQLKEKELTQQPQQPIQEQIQQNLTPKQLEKENFRGEPIEFEKLPEKLYHVTTNLSAVNESGILKRGGTGDKGLGGVHKVVSFTTDPEIAKQLESDVKFAANYYKKFPSDKQNGLNVYKFLQNQSKNEGWLYENMYDDPSIPRKEFEDEINRMSPLDQLKDYFRMRDRTTGKPNPVFLDKIKANPENIGIIEVNKNQIQDKSKIRTGDNWLKEAAVYADVSLQKPLEKEIVASPGGIGEVEKIEDGKATINVDGKTHQVHEKALLKPPREAALEALELIKSFTPEQERSTHHMLNAYDENERKGFFVFHNGSAYVVDDISPEEYKELSEEVEAAKTTGENIIGKWAKGEGSRGAGYNKIVKGVRERKVVPKLKKTFRKLNVGYNLLKEWQRLINEK